MCSVLNCLRLEEELREQHSKADTTVLQVQDIIVLHHYHHLVLQVDHEADLRHWSQLHGIDAEHKLPVAAIDVKTLG